jgi:DNA-binding NtrC family response regulator
MGLAKLLVVDDDPLTLRALTGTLECRLYNVSLDTALCASDALQKLKMGEFDVVLSDLQMPGVSGLTLATRIRQHHPLLPVLLMSGDCDDAGTAMALRNEAFAFIKKPVNRDELTILMKRAIELSQLRKAVIAMRAQCHN